MRRSQRPRIVLVTRKTPLELLLEQHGTLGQAQFYLRSRGQDTRWHEESHERFVAGLATVQAAIPADQRRVRVDRADLDRFLFATDDVVVMVGQDGLVPNTAKYLNGQAAIGINPDPDRYDGVLCQHHPGDMPYLLAWIERREESQYVIQQRIMAAVDREDGQHLLALNEVFVGHRTHQSARYRICAGGREERQSSSGLICATGTGSTGWARSIARQRGATIELPAPDEPRLTWFVREPFPSVATGTELELGFLGPGESLELYSELGDDGVIFADGIESDRLEFLDGHVARIGIADERLNLVVRASP